MKKYSKGQKIPKMKKGYAKMKNGYKYTGIKKYSLGGVMAGIGTGAGVGKDIFSAVAATSGSEKAGKLAQIAGNVQGAMGGGLDLGKMKKPKSKTKDDGKPLAPQIETGMDKDPEVDVKGKSPYGSVDPYSSDPLGLSDAGIEMPKMKYGGKIKKAKKGMKKMQSKGKYKGVSNYI